MPAHDVFISYASRDKLTAGKVCSFLEANGVRCWITPRDILPGSDWGESIIDAINEARVMLLVFSSHSNVSEHIKREVERAVNRGKAIIPFRIEDVMPSKSLEYFISAQHWLDAYTPPLEGHLQHLASTIKILLSKIGEEREIVEPAPYVETQPEVKLESPPSFQSGLMQPMSSEVMQPVPIVAEQAPKSLLRNTTYTNLAILVGGAVLALILIGGFIWWKSRELPVKQQAQSASMRPNEKTNASNVSNVNTLLEQGRGFVKTKDYDKARAILEKAVQLDPQNVQAYLALGDAYLGLKRYSEAIEASRQIIKIDPKNTNAYNRIGFVCMEQGRYQEAIEYLRTALTIIPGFIPAISNLGYAYANLGNLEKAREVYLELEKQNKEKAEKLLTFINKKAMEKASSVSISESASGKEIDYLKLLKAQVKSIKLFESGKGTTPQKKRFYENKFLKSTTRYINFEISLTYPKPNRRIEFPINSEWYRSDGSLIRKTSHQAKVDSSWKGSLHHYMLGNEEYGVYWPLGDYRVDVYIGHNKIGSQAFKVVEP